MTTTPHAYSQSTSPSHAGLTVQQIAEGFQRDGFFKIPGLLSPAELQVLREDSARIIDGGWKDKENPTDYFHAVQSESGEDTFYRVQYIFPKARRNSFLGLLGHPFILSVVHHLLGDDFVCAAEAMVFKMPRAGKEVPVHADCDPADGRLSPLIFNVDFYLDDANPGDGPLMVAPGSHTSGLTSRQIQEEGFDFPGLIELPARAGDVFLHDVRLVHGSRATRGTLRRTLYYEFQSMEAMKEQGGPRPGFPMTEAFIRDRYRLLMRAIDVRRRSPYAADETPYPYKRPASYDIPWPAEDEAVNLRPALGHNAYI